MATRQTQTEEEVKAGQQGSEGSGDGQPATGTDNGQQNDGQNKPGGDKTIALRQERERRQRLSQENEALREKLAAMQQQGGTDESLDFSEFQVTDDEILNGSAEQINRKMQGMIAKATQAAANRMNSQLIGKQSLDKALGKYEIFSDTGDSELAADALAATEREIEAIPREERTPAKVEDAIANVAKRYSRYRVDRSEERQGSFDEEVNHPLPTTGGGTGEAAHMKSQAKPPESSEEAAAMARQSARRIAEAKGMRWD